MTIKIAIIGSKGKMGKNLIFSISQDKNLLLAWELSSKGDTSFFSKEDVIIDFSTKEALQENLNIAISRKSPIVIGTTGLGEEEKKAIQEAAKKIPVFWSANFSLGIAAAVYITEKLASILKTFPSHITETHHIHKKDHPSGSAIAIKEASERGNPSFSPDILSYRLDEVIGEHTITFNGENEKLTLSHEVFSREAFSKGALEAAKFLCKQPPGFYQMKNLLEPLK